VVLSGNLAAARRKASTTRLNLGYPVFNITLTFTLTNFQWFLGNRLVGKNANPDFTATLNMTRHRPTSGFNLTRSDSSARG